MGHNTRLMKCWLSVHKKRVIVGQMPVNDLSSDVQKLGKTISLFRVHMLKMDLHTGLFIFNDICSRMFLGSISNSLSKTLSIE